MLVSNSSLDASVAAEALAVWIEGPSSMELSSAVYRNQCIIGAALANNKLHLLKPGASSECWVAHLHLLAVLCKDHALNQSYLLHQDGFVDRLLAILRDGEDIGPSMKDLMECLASQWQDFDLALHVMHHPQGMTALMAGLDSKSEQCRLASSTILLAMAQADTYCLVGREEWAGQGGVSGQPGVLEKLLKCPGGPHKPHQILMMMLAAVDSQHKDKLLAYLAGEDAQMHKAAYLVARTAAWQYISRWHYEETDEYEGRYRNGSSGPATTAKDLYPAYPFDLARVNTKSGYDMACVLYAEASLASSWALEAIVGLLASQYPEERVGAGWVLLDGLNDHPSSHLLPVLLQPEVAKGLAQVLPESAELTERAVRVLGWWLKQDGSSLDQASRQFIEQLMALPCMVEAKAAEERAYAEEEEGEEEDV